MEDNRRLAAIVQGIWQRNPEAWSSNPTHLESIPKWLGWLDVARTVRQSAVEELQAFAGEVRREGFTHALLMGMGGSSLAPEVMRLTCGVAQGFLDLAVLDSTDPAMVLDFQRRLPPEQTLYLVSTKSGTTTETVSFQRSFYEATRRVAGERAGRQFVAITDAGTALERLAGQLGFRRTFLNPPDIGGRYSALSYFGLVPAALLGIDLAPFLDRALEAMHACAPEREVAENSGAQLGAALAGHAASGRDKVTLVCAERFRSFGYWVEQLLAESTGKEGKGLIPVEGEALGEPSSYGDDRLFVAVGEPGEGEAARLRALEAAGHPVIRLPAREPDDLAYQFFIWEFATAVAGALMDIDAFDQPNVQESKDNTERVLGEYVASGRLPTVPEVTPGEGATQALSDLLRDAAPGEYVALMAYLPRTAANDAALTRWRLALRDHLKLATTLGYGPRFLHSTGQLHKGGPDTGRFIQVVGEDAEDAPIPEAPYGFSILKQAQAIGDLQALQAHGRSVVRVRVGQDTQAAINALALETVPLLPIWEAGQPQAP
jgi:glucose-6-phosphate isomerase